MHSTEFKHNEESIHVTANIFKCHKEKGLEEKEEIMGMYDTEGTQFLK